MIRHLAKCQYSFLIFPTRINEMFCDTHVIHILNRSPRVSGQTNPLTSHQKLGHHCVLTSYIDLNTIIHHCIARMKLKSRFNNPKQFLKPHPLHCQKRHSSTIIISQSVSLISFSEYLAIIRFLQLPPSL
jgi:hypothetical protein